MQKRVSARNSWKVEEEDSERVGGDGSSHDERLLLHIRIREQKLTLLYRGDQQNQEGAAVGEERQHLGVFAGLRQRLS